MCVVSMVYDHYRDKWPDPRVWPSQPNPPPFIPSIIPEKSATEIGKIQITIAEYFEYQELKRKAQEYDARTGQPDCEKPDITQWEAAIEEFLKENYGLEKFTEAQKKIRDRNSSRST